MTTLPEKDSLYFNAVNHGGVKFRYRCHVSG